MNNKLLNKTLRIYLIYSVLVLIIAAPLFYFITQRFYIDEADELLLQHKEEFLQSSLIKLSESDVPLWNKYNKDVKIEAAKEEGKETLLYTFYYDSLTEENEPYRELNFPIKINNKPYTYVSRINLVESEDFMVSIAVLFTVLITVLLVGLFFITKKLSFKLWNPFYATLQQMECFEIDKMNLLPFQETDIEEFNRLNQSIRNLIDRNIAIYDGQREFIENAAHELQTPLAVFQAKIDTLMQNTDVTEEQSEILISINSNISRLNRLNKNLLLLSKIDSNQFSETTSFSVKELIEKQLDFFSEQAQQKNIKIDSRLDGDIKLNTNMVLTEILISNLFLNAIRHNIPDGDIALTLNQNLLTFSNTGSLNSLNTEKLFTRFSKANNSEQGNGLGLAIIKKIADLNSWKIGYNFVENKHTFILQF